jgi:hypothetical protein
MADSICTVKPPNLLRRTTPGSSKSKQKANHRNCTVPVQAVFAAPASVAALISTRPPVFTS